MTLVEMADDTRPNSDLHTTSHHTDAQLIQDVSARLAQEASSFSTNTDPPLLMVCSILVSPTWQTRLVLTSSHR